MLQECIIIKVDFKPFLSGVLSLLFFLLKYLPTY